MAAATPEIWRVLDALQGEFTGEDEARELAVRGLLLQLGVLLLRVLSAAGAGEGSAFYVGSVSRRTLKFLR